MITLLFALSLSAPAHAGPIAEVVLAGRDRKEARNLVGDWHDVRSGDRISVTWEEGLPTVTGVESTRHDETYAVVTSHYASGILTFSYFVPSTGWEVRWELMRPIASDYSVDAEWQSKVAGATVQKGTDMLVWIDPRS